MADAKLTSLIIKIAANGASAQAELKALEREVGKFAKNMERLGSTMSKYLTAPLVAAGAVAVNAANTQMQAEARLLTALKGREDIQGRLLKQATELQSRSIYGDEAVIEQQAFLAALGLTESQINATINAAAQLSAALGMEFSSAVRNLSKSYSGLAGELGESIPALRELTQEEMKAGGAIAYVNNNYKGFAETMATTGMGPLQQLKNSLGDLAEQFGTILVPIVQKLATHLKEIVERFQQLSPRTKEIITNVAALAAALGPLLIAGGKLVSGIKTIIPLIPQLGTALTAFTSTAVGGAATAIAGLLAIAARAVVELKNMKREFAESVKTEAYDKGYSLTMTSFSSASTAEVERALKEQQAALDALASAKGKLKAAEYERLDKLPGIIAALQDILAKRIETPPIAEGVEEVVVETQKALPLIPQLEAKIKSLNEQLSAATSESQIAIINKDLEKTNAELQRLKELRPEFEKVAGISTGGNPFLGKVAMKPTALLDSILPDPNAYGDSLIERAKAIADLNTQIGNILQGSFVDFATMIGEGLGALMSGADFDWGSKILELLGSTLKSLGQALVTYATTMEAFKTAMETVFTSPWVAIAAGVAAIAAGAALTNLAKKPIKLATGGLAYGPTLAVVGDNPGASSDPEVVAPLSKLRSYMGGGQSLELVGDVAFQIHGDSLRAVLNREQVRLNRMGK